MNADQNINPMEAFTAIFGEPHEVDDGITAFFGKPISVYTRKQAIADGVLVDVSNVIDGDTAQRNPFKYPVAMTRACYEATIAAGGTWEPDGEGETLKLRGGQDVADRLHDVFWLLGIRIRCTKAESNDPRQAVDRVTFRVFVDTYGNGRKTAVDCWAHIGPGDDAAPVITIMLQGED